MLDSIERITFTATLILYFLGTVSYLIYGSTGKEKTARPGRLVTTAGVCFHLVSIITRGIHAGRLPLTNQFEFATSFACGIAIVFLIFTRIYHFDILGTFIVPVIFLVIGYAAMQSRDIHALMPALQSGWLGFHVSTAIIAYGAFGVAFGVAGAYLVKDRKDGASDASRTTASGAASRIPDKEVLDNIIYRAVALGFLFLTLCMITGAVWANRAWGSYWSWDPKETWSLITWFVYAIFLHLRLNKGMNGRKAAIFALIGFICVIFTYVGVNTLMSGLHSYK